MAGPVDISYGIVGDGIGIEEIPARRDEIIVTDEALRIPETACTMQGTKEFVKTTLQWPIGFVFAVCILCYVPLAAHHGTVIR